MTPLPSTLYNGTSLSLTCTITVNSAVDTTVNVTITWGKTRGTGIVPITTGVKTVSFGPTFTSTATVLTLSTLDTGFTCRAVVNPQAGGVISSSPEGMDTQPTSVLGKDQVSIIVSQISGTGTSVKGPS